jgi:glutaminase
MCPRESKKEYKELIQNSMILAEKILEIEKQLQRGDIRPDFRYRTQAQANYNILMRDLRGNVKKYFHTEILHKITDKVDHLGILLADHLTNIRNLTTL